MECSFKVSSVSGSVADLPLWSSTKSVFYDKENQYFRKKICMNNESIKKTLSHSFKKSVSCQISRKKIYILPNSKGKKSVYTDKISISGRSAVAPAW